MQRQRAGGVHAAACEAAAGVRMARSVGKSNEFEHWLFANQPSLSPDKVKEGLQEVAGISDFDARYATVLPAIKSDTALGASLGVQSTPTFFINGVRIRGRHQSEDPRLHPRVRDRQGRRARGQVRRTGGR